MNVEEEKKSAPTTEAKQRFANEVEMKGRERLQGFIEAKSFHSISEKPSVQEYDSCKELSRKANVRHKISMKLINSEMEDEKEELEKYEFLRPRKFVSQVQSSDKMPDSLEEVAAAAKAMHAQSNKERSLPDLDDIHVEAHVSDNLGDHL